MKTLNEVTQYWGNTTLIESDPGEDSTALAIYAPFRNDLYFHNDPAWGIYNRDGRLNQAAAYYRGPNKTLVGQSPSTTLNANDLEVVNEEFVYGGPVIMHYGHFLTAALPRLWRLRSMPAKRRRIVCHGHESPVEWFKRDFVRDIFYAIGLTAEDFVRFEHPILLKRLLVPRPAMEEQNFIHRACDDLARRIGRFYGVHQQARGEKKIYLSKTRLTAGITRFANEHVLEAYLSDRGITIAHPHELSFPDQLRLLAEANVICGTVGSAMHTSIFLDRPSRIVALTANNLVNANYALIDKLKSNEALYLYPNVPGFESSGQDGFSSTWTMDLAATAQEFAARI